MPFCCNLTAQLPQRAVKIHSPKWSGIDIQLGIHRQAFGQLMGQKQVTCNDVQTVNAVKSSLFTGKPQTSDVSGIGTYRKNIIPVILIRHAALRPGVLKRQLPRHLKFYFQGRQRQKFPVFNRFQKLAALPAHCAFTGKGQGYKQILIPVLCIPYRLNLPQQQGSQNYPYYNHTVMPFLIRLCDRKIFCRNRHSV